MQNVDVKEELGNFRKRNDSHYVKNIDKSSNITQEVKDAVCGSVYRFQFKIEIRFSANNLVMLWEIDPSTCLWSVHIELEEFMHIALAKLKVINFIFYLSDLDV